MLYSQQIVQEIHHQLFLLSRESISITAALCKMLLEETESKGVPALLALPGMQLWYSAFVKSELVSGMVEHVLYAVTLPQAYKPTV
jgi:hypothetical protein